MTSVAVTPELLRVFLTEVKLALALHPAYEGKRQALSKSLRALRLFSEGRLTAMSQIELEFTLRVMRYRSDLKSYLPEHLRDLDLKGQQKQIIQQLQALQILRKLTRTPSEDMRLPDLHY